MKKLTIAIFALLLMSCKKDNVEPTYIEPTTVKTVQGTYRMSRVSLSTNINSVDTIFVTTAKYIKYLDSNRARVEFPLLTDSLLPSGHICEYLETTPLNDVYQYSIPDNNGFPHLERETINYRASNQLPRSYTYVIKQNGFLIIKQFQPQ